MAKPKGATLTRLFAVSDAERKAFWLELEGKKGKRAGIPETGTPETGTPETDTPALRTPRGNPPSGQEQVSRAATQLMGTPVSGLPESGTPESRTRPSAVADKVLSEPFNSAGVSATPVVSQLGRVPVSGVPVSGVPVLGPPELGAPLSPVLNTPLFAVSPRRKVREAIKVQDGHSLGEQAVYAALWAAGPPYTEDSRRLTIGYRTLSDACGLTVNNCKANLQSLVRKLAIEVVAEHTSTLGTTYLVHSYQAILRRRRQAGMTHVVRTKGVIFINPETGIPVSGIPLAASGTPATGTAAHESGAPEPTKSGIPVPDTPIRNRKLIEETNITEEPSSSFPVVIAAARECGLTLDDDAARRIVLRCQVFDETATETEVAYFLQAKAGQFRNSRTISNLVGLLIKAVPQYFAAPATELSELRSSRLREAERQRKQNNEAAREILVDPEASESEREWARAVLGEATEAAAGGAISPK